MWLAIKYITSKHVRTVLEFEMEGKMLGRLKMERNLKAHKKKTIKIKEKKLSKIKSRRYRSLFLWNGFFSSLLTDALPALSLLTFYCFRPPPSSSSFFFVWKVKIKSFLFSFFFLVDGILSLKKMKESINFFFFFFFFLPSNSNHLRGKEQQSKWMRSFFFLSFFFLFFTSIWGFLFCWWKKVKNEAFKVQSKRYLKCS